MPPLVTVIVPLKALGAAKGRLASVLDPAARLVLVRWMAERVLAACRGCARVGDVLVVAGDHAAADLAGELGARAIRVPQPGLPAAIAAADLLLSAAPTTLVVAADLPLAQPGDIEAVVAAADGLDRAVVVAPTLDGGTGALLRRPAGVMTTAYGPGSADAHLALAAAAGVPAVRLEVANLAADVDTPDQLRVALASVPGADVGSPEP